MKNKIFFIGYYNRLLKYTWECQNKYVKKYVELNRINANKALGRKEVILICIVWDIIK